MFPGINAHGKSTRCKEVRKLKLTAARIWQQRSDKLTNVNISSHHLSEATTGFLKLIQLWQLQVIVQGLF